MHPVTCETQEMQEGQRPKKRMVEKVITVPGNLQMGCDEFNAGLFYECHERFEEIWQYERGPVRDLYKGLIQLAAGFVHLSRANYSGAERLLRTGMGYLEPYRESGAMGFDVERISGDAAAVYRRLLDLGSLRVRELDLALRPWFAFDAEALRTEAIRWGAWGFDDSGASRHMTIVIAE